MRRATVLALALVFAAGTAQAVDDRAAAAAATVGPTAAECTAPATLLAIGAPLHRVAARLKAGEPLTIVALGSSSTRGYGASAPQMSYPSRLEVELRERLPGVAVRVVNRGRNGDEIPQMLERVAPDVVAEHPDLVIWQMGTNAVLHGDTAADEQQPIAQGIAQIQESGADVVLMDLQYAPKVLAKPGYAAMETVIAEAAQRAHVGRFRRFEIMQHWQASSEDRAWMVGADGLHMTDRGYACLASELADSLIANWRPRIAQSGGTQTVAGVGASGVSPR